MGRDYCGILELHSRIVLAGIEALIVRDILNGRFATCIKQHNYMLELIPNKEHNILVQLITTRMRVQETSQHHMFPTTSLISTCFQPPSNLLPTFRNKGQKASSYTFSNHKHDRKTQRTDVRHVMMHNTLTVLYTRVAVNLVRPFERAGRCSKRLGK